MSFKIFTMMNHFYLGAGLRLAQVAAEEPTGGQPYVVGAITCAVSFLEISINSLFEEGVVRSSRKTKFRAALADVWSEAFDRQPTLAKYQIALALARVEGFATNREPYQSAEALITLRNFLAHPKNVFWNEKEEERLLKKLKGKFSFRLSGPDHAFFPDACFSPECGRWAILTAARFVQAFDQKLPPSARLVTIDLHSYIATAEKI
jgi:hypothetical protein